MSSELFIDGVWQDGAGSEFNAIDAAKNQVYWQGKAATEQQVEQALLAARHALPEWSGKNVAQRLIIIQGFAELVAENKDQLALTIAQETGKPLWETQTEVAAMIGKVKLSEQAYHDRSGEKENQVPAGKAYTRHKPQGVVAVFGPYNFPAHLPNGHIVPALIAGNCIVFKPSELTPKTAQLVVELWHQAGLPKGVLNLVQGQLVTSKALASHKQLDGLFFTGSSATGVLLHQQFAGQPEKILALEMGGNNPLVVDEVDDIDAAVYTIIQSAFISGGQRCTCARRLLVKQGEGGDKLLERLVDVCQTLKVDVYDAEPQPFYGSLVSQQAAVNILFAQQQLIQQGGQALLSANMIRPDTGLISPGIIDVTQISKLADEEHFGPLLKVIRYQNFEQAIEIANDTRYGLSAGLLSNDAQLWHIFYQQIRAGIVNWNKPITGASGAAPFGGVGLSGNHRASAYYAADYCAYPVASVEAEQVSLPDTLSPGIKL